MMAGFAHACRRGRSLGVSLTALVATACVGQANGPADGAASFTPGQVVEVVSGAPAGGAGGRCTTLPQTAWVTAVAPVQVQAQHTLGPDHDRLACVTALNRLQWTAEQRCRVAYANSSLYRNGRLLSLPVGLGDCACTSSSLSNTTCVVSATAECGYEVLQTRSVQVCE